MTGPAGPRSEVDLGRRPSRAVRGGGGTSSAAAAAAARRRGAAGNNQTRFHQRGAAWSDRRRPRELTRDERTDTRIHGHTDTNSWKHEPTATDSRLRCAFHRSWYNLSFPSPVFLSLISRLAEFCLRPRRTLVFSSPPAETRPPQPHVRVAVLVILCRTASFRAVSHCESAVQW